jgi:Anti-anti-sigma regulatory factor (antagonist of anti-sigma factor)
VKLNTRQVGDVSVVDVAGRITLGEGSSALRDTLRGLVTGNHKRILLNLGDVSYIDSSGIGELVSGFTTVTNQGGQLKLLKPHQAGEGPAADHQALYGLRRPRRRSLGGAELQRDGLTAADELHDFHLGAGGQHRLRPEWLLDDPAVEFDGHARGIEPQRLQESQHGLPFPDGTTFAVDSDLHVG